MKFPLGLGPSNVAQSYIADQQDTINFYPEMASPGQVVLFPTPGVAEIGSVANAGGRGHAAFASREWAVVAGKFYEIDRNGTFTQKGSVAVGDNPATLSYNGDGGGEIFITSGQNGYIYDIGADTLTQISALNGIADMGDHIDGYFLALDQATSTWYFSDLRVGTTWQTGTNFIQRSAASDPWVSFKVLRGELIWLFGDTTSEVWYNAGTFPRPFEPHPSGRAVQYGCDAPFSPAIENGVLYWLGKTEGGRGQVYATTGFVGNRISKPSVEFALQAYDRSADAIGDSYTEAGHSFFLLRVPNEITWCFDAATREWHKRGTWISEQNRYRPARTVHHAHVFDQHRWLDIDSGSVYRADIGLGDDVGGTPVRRVRRTPGLVHENQRLFYASAELLMAVGIGLSGAGCIRTPGNGTGLDDSLFDGASFSAYYEFEGNGDDERPGGSDLTEVNSPSYVLGVKDQGAQLVAVTDTSDSPHFKIDAASATSFNPGTDDFGLGAWFYAASDSVSGQLSIFSKGADPGDTPQPAGWFLYYDANAGTLVGFVGSGGVAAVQAKSTAVPKGEWHFGAMTVDRTSDVLTLYLDGEVSTTASVSTLGSITSSQDLMVGGIDPKIGDGNVFDGVIDQAAFVVGKVWTAEQIKQIYNTEPVLGTDPQVMLRWSDDGGRTWSSQQWRSAGKIGQYDTRVRWNRLGQARKRVFEIVCSDPVPYALADFFVELGDVPRGLRPLRQVS